VAAPRARHRLAVATSMEAESVTDLADAISAIGAADVTVLSHLEELRSFKVFSLYSVDLLANCAYLGGELQECEFDACEVLPAEPVPTALMERDETERGFELDSWARFDLPSEDYYDLEEYPEGYTGYDGAHVWKFVYDKICFSEEEEELDEDPNGWRHVFDRAVSGLHSSIACHIVDDYSEDDAECAREYHRRVGAHPARVRNLHFCFALVLTALREARQGLESYVFEPDDADADARIKKRVESLAKAPILEADELKRMAPLLRASAQGSAECVLIEDDSNEWLEETGLWQVRQRSRAVLRLFDCVQCGACRIHGKVAWLGVATALKLIYSDASARPLCRVEVAALLTTLAKLGTAIRFSEEMEELVAEEGLTA